MIDGKVAIVTGAAGGGMGRSIALTLARDGARVVVNYRTSQTQARAIVATHSVKLSPAYAYNVAKAARADAMLLAQDQAWSHGVTVNVIAPGPVAGLPDTEAAIDQSQHGAACQGRKDLSPQDIAEGVAFLCSDSGRFISGCVLPYLFN